MPKDGGGAAFPGLPEPYPEMTIQRGMTLRDWFAGQAVAGITTLGLGGWSHVTGDNEDNARRNNQAMSKRAYGIADAMLEERKK